MKNKFKILLILMVMILSSVLSFFILSENCFADVTSVDLKSSNPYATVSNTGVGTFTNDEFNSYLTDTSYMGVYRNGIVGSFSGKSTFEFTGAINGDFVNLFSMRVFIGGTNSADLSNFYSQVLRGKSWWIGTNSQHPNDIAYVPIFEFNGYTLYGRVKIITDYSNTSNLFIAYLFRLDLTSIFLQEDFGSERLDFDLTNNILTFTAPIEYNGQGSSLSFRWRLFDGQNSYNSSLQKNVSDLETFCYSQYLWSFGNYFYDSLATNMYISKVNYNLPQIKFHFDVIYSALSNYRFNSINYAVGGGGLSWLSGQYNINDSAVVLFQGSTMLSYYATAKNNITIVNFNNDYTSNVIGYEYYYGGNNSTIFNYSLNSTSSNKFGSTMTMNKYYYCTTYLAFDGDVSNNLTSFINIGDNNYSQNLYKQNIPWYDIFGQLYNFLIYLIFDMPLINNITRPVYFLISSFLNLLNYSTVLLTGLGIVGSIVLFSIFISIIKKWL